MNDKAIQIPASTQTVRTNASYIVTLSFLKVNYNMFEWFTDWFTDILRRIGNTKSNHRQEFENKF